MSLRLILIHFIYRVVFGVGIAALMWVGGHFVFAQTYQWHAMSRFKNDPGSTTGMSDFRLPSRVPLRSLRLRPGLEIPDREPPSDMVLESDENVPEAATGPFRATLPGRLAGAGRTTSFQLGDEKVADDRHRNAFDRQLHSLHVGDTIQLSTPRGSFGYFVTTIEVIDPSEPPISKSPGHSEIRIITTSSSPSAGAMPQQFVVHARPQDELSN